MSKLLIKAIYAGNTQEIIKVIYNAQKTNGPMGHVQLLQERNTLGESPLICAIKKKYMYVAEVLIGLDNNLNYTVPSTGDTAMMYAARLGHESIVNQLITAGANINAKNKLGQTASEIAAEYNNHNSAPENILILKDLTKLLKNQQLNTISNNIYEEEGKMPTAKLELEEVNNLNKSLPYTSLNIPQSAFIDIDTFQTQLGGKTPIFEDS
jgi:ankyrin repeat protein